MREQAAQVTRTRWTASVQSSYRNLVTGSVVADSTLTVCAISLLSTVIRIRQRAPGLPP